MNRRALARVALGIAILSAIWAAILIAFGGFDLSLFGTRVTAHEPRRPLVAALVAFIVYTWAIGAAPVLDRVAQAVRALDRARRRVDARIIAAALAVSLTGAALGWTSHSVGGSDSYGYASEAELWLKGPLVISQPWAASVPWPDANRTFTPLAYHPGQQPNSIVPTYSPGLPMLMAAAKLLVGQCGVFAIVPLSAGVAVLATFAFARRLVSSEVGIAAAWLLATSPVFLFMTMAPMSDVPTTAAWAVVFWCAAGDGMASAGLGGLAAGIAVLLRPNLAPMALLIPLWLLAKAWWAAGLERRRHAVRTAAFLAVLAPAFITVAALNQVWNGSPMRAGYGALSDLFAWSNVKPNIGRYFAWFADSQTPIAFAGILALLLPIKRLWPDLARSMVPVMGLFVILIWFEYCAYTPFDAWWYLRFLLPCWPFVMIGVAVVFVRFAGSFNSRLIAAAGVLVVLALGAHGLSQAYRQDFISMGRSESKYPAIAKIVRQNTDRTAVILSGQHSGSLRYYAGRMTMTHFNLDPAWLDRAVEWLAGHGAHPYAVLEDWEVAEFRSRFGPANTVGRLDMPPLIEYYGSPTIYVFDLLRRPDSPEPPQRLGESFDLPMCPAPSAPPTIRFRE